MKRGRRPRLKVDKKEVTKKGLDPPLYLVNSCWWEPTDGQNLVHSQNGDLSSGRLGQVECSGVDSW